MIPPVLHLAFHQVQSSPQNSVMELCFSFQSNLQGNLALLVGLGVATWDMKGLI